MGLSKTSLGISRFKNSKSKEFLYTLVTNDEWREVRLYPYCLLFFHFAISQRGSIIFL